MEIIKKTETTTMTQLIFHQSLNFENMLNYKVNS